MRELIIKQLEFYSYADEKNFFKWIESINEVNDVKGRADEILIKISDNISSESLREIIAIFSRYCIEMTQLSQFKNIENEDWFFDDEMYWFNRIFKS
ncbi:hypothetical protein ACIPPQ_21315 [Sphingopyxis sp. LARHCG72]